MSDLAERRVQPSVDEEADLQAWLNDPNRFDDPAPTTGAAKAGSTETQPVTANETNADAATPVAAATAPIADGKGIDRLLGTSPITSLGETPTAKPERKRRGFILGGIAAGAAAIATVVTLVAGGGKSNEQDPGVNDIASGLASGVDLSTDAVLGGQTADPGAPVEVAVETPATQPTTEPVQEVTPPAPIEVEAPETAEATSWNQERTLEGIAQKWTQTYQALVTNTDNETVSPETGLTEQQEAALLHLAGPDGNDALLTDALNANQQGYQVRIAHFEIFPELSSEMTEDVDHVNIMMVQEREISGPAGDPNGTRTERYELWVSLDWMTLERGALNESGWATTGYRALLLQG